MAGELPAVPDDLVRIGDAERAAAAGRLSDHAAAGRLTIEELEERLERVHRAVVVRDLLAVEGDLPGPARERLRPRPPRPAPDARWRAATPAGPRPAPPLTLPVVVLLLAVLASGAAGHPVFPLFVLAALLFRAAGRRRWPSHGPPAAP